MTAQNHGISEDLVTPSSAKKIPTAANKKAKVRRARTPDHSRGGNNAIYMSKP